MDARAASREAFEANGSTAPLWIHILATTAEGTQCALASARRLTKGRQARVVVLVPTPRSLFVPDASSGGPAARIDEQRAAAAELGIGVMVLGCVCERLDDLVHSMVGPSSLVIVGGRRRSWWPSREQRIVERLTAAGYPVVFAQVGVEPAQTAVPAVS